MTNQTELKPCPFCGVKPYFSDYPQVSGRGKEFSAACHNSNCEVSPYVISLTESEAAELWNHRPYEARMRDEALEEAAKVADRVTGTSSPLMIATADIVSKAIRAMKTNQ